MVMNCQNLFLKEHVLILVSMIFTLEKDSDFSGCCLGVGTRYDMLTELSRREKEAGIKPDPEIDAFMKVTSIEVTVEVDYKIRHTNIFIRFFRQLLAFFCVNQMPLPLFRFIAVIGRTRVVANTFGSITILVIFVLSGFTVSRDDIEPWMIWCHYASPMMYGMTAISINEFLDKRWSAVTPNIDPRIDEPTVGKAFLKARGIFTEDYWYWISIRALIGFSLLFNVCFILALTYLDPFRSSKSIIVEQEDNRESTTKSSSVEKTTGDMTESSASNVESFEGVDMEVRNSTNSSIPKAAKNAKFKKGMVFYPFSLCHLFLKM
ncbi:pleiotropic drug resistance protein 2 [Medicago truncatula]|uniref:pleiotropic drug resistance protein 2 n=1 Tax=Medicago truncatula TaxID=3880 RepID=UPI001967214D|nr:pleiotropic drug resistance protein 2 [Medicago truncatula]